MLTSSGAFVKLNKDDSEMNEKMIETLNERLIDLIDVLNTRLKNIETRLAQGNKNSNEVKDVMWDISNSINAMEVSLNSTNINSCKIATDIESLRISLDPVAISINGLSGAVSGIDARLNNIEYKCVNFDSAVASISSSLISLSSSPCCSTDIGSALDNINQSVKEIGSNIKVNLAS